VFDRLVRSMIVSGIAGGIFALAATPAGAATTTFYLDSYNPVDGTPAFCSGANMMATTTPPGCGNAVTSPVVFNPTPYTVVVTGAVSAWHEWPFRRCGRPDPSAEFATPGKFNEPVGDDAQFRFAKPLYIGKCPPMPKKSSFFQVNLGSGWFHPIADGEPTKPSGDVGKPPIQHPYTFTFTGQGVAPQFRFVDFHPSDNSGQFKIVATG
jgi:hypothetical protein